jgi:ubiquitin-protein ligase
MNIIQKNISDPTLLCIKRITKEYNDIYTHPIPNIKLYTKEDNLLNLYCLIYDLTEDEYKNGEYIFNIKISPNYPFKPPSFIFLTPNGRFDTNTALCFSNSSFHIDTWSPMWNIKTIILGFLSFFLEKKSIGIGHINSDINIKKEYATQSINFNKINYSNICFN